MFNAFTMSQIAEIRTDVYGIAITELDFGNRVIYRVEREDFNTDDVQLINLDTPQKLYVMLTDFEQRVLVSESGSTNVNMQTDVIHDGVNQKIVFESVDELRDTVIVLKQMIEYIENGN